MRNNLWDWQSLQPNSGPGQDFFQFCDALEVKDGVSAGPEGRGLDHAIKAWGAHWKSGYLANLCDDQSIAYVDFHTVLNRFGSNMFVFTSDCLGSYDPNADYYTNTTIDNSGRSWYWMV